MHTHAYVCNYMYMHIHVHMSLSLSIYIYIYTYISTTVFERPSCRLTSAAEAAP